MKPAPRDVHDADQLGAHLVLTARILGDYRRELERQACFTEDEIMALLIEMQTLLTTEADEHG